MFKRILLPLDGSSFAEEALSHALKFVRSFESELTLVTVIYPLSVTFGEHEMPSAKPIADVQNSIIEEATAYLKEKSDALRNENIIVSTELIKSADVASAILEYADVGEFDTIIMSTHGRSGLRRWVLGSIAERVTRQSSLPVLLIRPDDSEN